MDKNLIAKILILLLLLPMPLFSQIEDELDSQFLSEGGSATEYEDPLQTPLNEQHWEIYGYLQNENQFGVSSDKKVSEFDIIKLEGRGKIAARYGTDKFHAKTILNAFFYPDNDSENEQAISTPRESGTVEAQELYIGGGTKFRFKIGKQLYSWGTGDAFQVTNYLDQPDLREFFAVDKDDKCTGVFSLSVKYLFSDYAVELAVSPYQNSPLMPAGYWDLGSFSMNGMTVTIEEETDAKNTLTDTSFVARGGGTAGFLDFHLSYFNGISNSLIFKPELEDMTTVIMKPVYKRIQTAGIDISFTIDKFAVRAEGAYTFNMPAVIDPESTDNQIQALSADTEESPLLAYVAGADYNLWGVNGIVLVEWMQAKYLKNGGDYIEPFMTDLLLIRIQDKFFSERLEAELNCLLRPVQNKPGYGAMYEIGWNFQNGMTIATGGMFFTGNGDDLIKFLDNRDMIYTKARMEF